jgi:predicted DsbA family dithiol-disulfide isomerase
MDHIDPANTPLLMDRIFEAIWVEELDIESPQVLSDLMSDSEVPSDLLQRVVLGDELKPAIGVSVKKALEWGITGTPSWVIDNKLMVPGLQDDDFFDRVITKLDANRTKIREP